MSSTPPSQPSLPWRATSSFVMGLTGALSRAFLFGLSNTELIGLERFIEIIDGRKDVAARERGLLTVSNHVSIIDDPIVWGALPFKYAFNATNHRWSLASHDLCFQNKFASAFFSFGQTLPIHRSKYSPYGGLFQPTMTQAIRLLSAQPFSSSEANTNTVQTSRSINLKAPDLTDPFASGNLTYSTNGVDILPAPPAYPSRRHSWVHIFPEGFIHQHPSVRMRYFKWGVSRLILESEPLPQIIPIFIAGTEQVMHESREFPRFLPRTGKNITIAFGEEIDGERVFGDLRKRWKRLVIVQKDALRGKGEDFSVSMGELTEGLMYAPEAVAIRKEVTRRMRQEVLKVRKDLGFPDEDPKAGLVKTWIEEGSKREGRMDDGSWVKDP